MLDSTLDLISQVVSSNLYVFCMFNLVIVMILMGSKQGSNFDQGYEIPVSTAAAAAAATPSCDKQDLEVKQIANRSEQAAHASKVSSACQTATEGANNGGDGNEDDEGDDELRRRVEEFIAKVNREWRAEKLRVSISA